MDDVVSTVMKGISPDTKFKILYGFTMLRLFVSIDQNEVCYHNIFKYVTMEVNCHFNIEGSFWKMTNPD